MEYFVYFLFVIFKFLKQFLVNGAPSSPKAEHYIEISVNQK